MKRYTILFTIMFTSVIALAQKDSSTTYKIEIDSLLKDSLLINNILQDLYSNTELLDSIYYNQNKINTLIKKEINNCDSIIFIENSKNKDYEIKIESLKLTNSKLNNTNKLKSKIITILTIVSIALTISCILK